MKMKHQEDISCIPDDCFTEITRHSPISRKYGQPHKVSVSISKWEAPQQTMKALRRLLGFSLIDMAKHFNVSPSTYHAYETGKYKAPDHVIHYFWLLHNTVKVLYNDLRNLAANNRTSISEQYGRYSDEATHCRIIATSYRSFEAFQKQFKDKNPTYLEYRIREAAILLAAFIGECEVEIVDIYKGD
ncbi:TPA: helix-turn-helix transcriptional regulator [Escherichia coli]|nr:helix-turn-helix transcriptional regulator [Escherichia coli]